VNIVKELRLAVQADDATKLRSALARRQSSTTTDRDVEHLLVSAIEKTRDVDIIRQLALHRPGAVDARCPRGLSALMKAVRNGVSPGAARRSRARVAAHRKRERNTRPARNWCQSSCCR
jgi:hypothetical protein